jgi:hypothetical protein
VSHARRRPKSASESQRTFPITVQFSTSDRLCAGRVCHIQFWPLSQFEEWHGYVRLCTLSGIRVNRITASVLRDKGASERKQTKIMAAHWPILELSVRWSRGHSESPLVRHSSLLIFECEPSAGDSTNGQPITRSWSLAPLGIWLSMLDEQAKPAR